MPTESSFERGLPERH